MMDTDILTEELQEAEERKERFRLEDDQFLLDLHSIFGTPAGRRVYAHILQECLVFETTFTGNSHTYFREGKRAVGLWLMQKMNQRKYEALEALELNQLELFLQQRRNEAKAHEMLSK